MSNDTIEKGYTGFVDGWLTGALRSQAADPADFKVFDWHKAAELIRDWHPQVVVAGLAEDWNNTAGEIYREDMEPEGIVPREDSWAYLGSSWATPAIELDGKPLMVCYEHPDVHGWDAETYWPESALEILGIQLGEIADDSQ